HLIGEHDFKSFCLAHSARGIRTKRNVSRIELNEVRIFEEPLLEVMIEGNAFLHNMVRNIVGSLVEVGKGMHDPIWMKHALEARNRQAAGCTAPAKGLIFWKVKY
ncbi:MAG: tRNA pseudouridine(38-40) synthase TruA, partial [Eggerthellaceae bacterium]|nr:tRNA pseudouridine(38-40) synthase TruA [Eggerthellaceae bacterium]